MKIRYAFIVCLILACALLATACNGAEGTQSATDSPAQSEEQTEKTTEQETVGESEIPHWKLPCRPIKKHSELHFALDSDFDLALSISEEWTLSESGGAYDISRDGENIGRISKGSAESEEWSIIEDYSRAHNASLRINKFIEKRGAGSGAEYRYRFEYIFENNESSPISLCVSYVELDGNAADRLYISPGICSATTLRESFLSDVADGSYLILGNSFIGSSDIGFLLREIFALNNKNCSVNAISRGYATVATYISSPEIMNSIRNGSYDAVFICGFYSDEEASNLVVLEEACKLSDTTLVIFPAHNESEKSINFARSKCPELPILDWRGELELIIESGVDKWELCINDQHLHSTTYAGLIGAHMIYRAIYGEIPSIDGMSTINVERAKDVFKGYLDVGSVPLTYDIYEFN